MSYIVIKSNILRQACEKAIKNVEEYRQKSLLQNFNKSQKSWIKKFWRFLFKKQKKEPTKENLNKFKKELSELHTCFIGNWMLEGTAKSLLGMCEHASEVQVDTEDLYYIEKFL